MINPDSVGYNVLSELDISYTFFSFDGLGIDTWITSDEVALLYYDRDLLEDKHFSCMLEK